MSSSIRKLMLHEYTEMDFVMWGAFAGLIFWIAWIMVCIVRGYPIF